MASTTVTILGNGPIKIEGDFTLLGNDGTPFVHKSTVFLCRCGQSSLKPLCDGAHKACGFVDAGEARDLAQTKKERDA